LRLNREESQYNYVDYYRVISYPTTNPATHIPYPSTYTDDVWTGKVGLQQQFDEDIMGFATVSRGYKGVGYDLTSNLSAFEASTFPVKRETSIDYELGTRTEWFAHHLVLNATAYWMDYKNFQISALAASPPAPPNTFILTNIPGVRTRGVEIASNAVITDDLTANLGYAYTDAYANNFPNGPCYSNETQLLTAPASCSAASKTQNLDGQALPNAPKHKITAGFDWKVLQQSAVTLDINATTVWQSKVNFGLNEDPGTVQGDYDITNLNFTFGLASDSRFTLSLFVNNLFDKHYYANVGNVAGNFTWPAQPAGHQVEAYTAEIPRDYDRFFGIRLAVASN
jgi:iron complex outermembrane receptor protein